VSLRSDVSSLVLRSLSKSGILVSLWAFSPVISATRRQRLCGALTGTLEPRRRCKVAVGTSRVKGCVVWTVVFLAVVAAGCGTQREEARMRSTSVHRGDGQSAGESRRRSTLVWMRMSRSLRRRARLHLRRRIPHGRQIAASPKSAPLEKSAPDAKWPPPKEKFSRAAKSAPPANRHSRSRRRMRSGRGK